MEKIINDTKPVKGGGVLTETIKDMNEFDMGSLAGTGK